MGAPALPSGHSSLPRVQPGTMVKLLSSNDKILSKEEVPDTLSGCRNIDQRLNMSKERLLNLIASK